MDIASKLRKDKVKGGEIITRILAAEGIERAFGIIDGTYFGMYSTFGEHGISLITPRHEASAVHMAAGYARLTGGIGLCMASNGPGVANALSGVAVENAEGNRVLLITSSRREGIAYPDRGGTFQYFPQVEVIGPMSKWSVAVPTVDRVAELTRQALRQCWIGRPGVVHLDVPESVMNGTFEVDPAWFRAPGTSRRTRPLQPAAADIQEAIDLLGRASRPLIHAGSGVLHAQAYDALQEVAEALGAPMTTSWGARPVMDERHPLAVPMTYVNAQRKARCEADAVLVIGSRLGETDFWAKAPYWASPDKQKLIQVDLELAPLGNNRPVDLAIQADAGAFLVALAAGLRERSFTPDRQVRKEWVDSLQAVCRARRKKLDKHLDHRSVPMHPAHIAGACQRVLGDDASLVIDGGNTSIWAHFYHQVRTPGTILGTPKMGMLGAGVSQAVAAKVARPEHPVACIIGDGAMGFHLQEVETAVRHGLQVIWLVVCDKQWGMVKINQHFALRPIKTLIRKSLPAEESINTDLAEIEFDQVARAMGAHGERVADAAGLDDAIARSVASGLPAVIHVDVDPVAHMWAPELKTFKDMHLEPKG